MKYLVVVIAFILPISLLAQSEPVFEKFEIDIKKSRVDFFEMIDHVEIIRLEETENSLLGEFDFYFKTPHGLVVIENDMKKPNRLILFSPNGDYQNVIDRGGNGPEEYRNISDAWYHNGNIELYSGYSRNIQRYTVEGEYIQTQQGGYGKGILGKSMIPYQDGYIFYQVDPTDPNETIEYNLLAFTDDELNIIAWGANNSEPNPAPFSLGRFFSFLNDSLFFRKPLNDSVFQIINRKLYPRFQYDFGEDWAWSDPESTTTLKKAIRTIVYSQKVFEVVPFIGEKYIFLNYYHSRSKSNDNIPTNKDYRRTGYINRETGEFHRLDLRRKDRADFDIKLLKWEDQYLVCSLLGYDIEEFIENLEEGQWTIKGGHDLDEILYLENPIILRIKLK